MKNLIQQTIREKVSYRPGSSIGQLQGPILDLYKKIVPSSRKPPQKQSSQNVVPNEKIDPPKTTDSNIQPSNGRKITNDAQTRPDTPTNVQTSPDNSGIPTTTQTPGLNQITSLGIAAAISAGVASVVATRKKDSTTHEIPSSKPEPIDIPLKNTPILRGDPTISKDQKTRRQKPSSLDNLERIQRQNARELQNVPSFITQEYIPIVRNDPTSSRDQKTKKYKTTSLNNIDRVRKQNNNEISTPILMTQSYHDNIPHEIGTDEIVKAYCDATPGQNVQIQNNRRKKMKNFRTYYEEKLNSINN